MRHSPVCTKPGAPPVVTASHARWSFFYFVLGDDAERFAAENLGHYYAYLGDSTIADNSVSRSLAT
jgi:hypothetical protein